MESGIYDDYETDFATHEKVVSLSTTSATMSRRLSVSANVDWRRARRALQEMDTEVADTVVAYDPATGDQLAVGENLRNPQDARLLETGCLPWEVTLHQFRDQFKSAVAEGTKSAE